jgi:hypothetical protein
MKIFSWRFHSCRGGCFSVNVMGPIVLLRKNYKSSAMFLKQRNEGQTWIEHLAFFMGRAS